MTRDAGDTIILEPSSDAHGTVAPTTCNFHFMPYADLGGDVSIQNSNPCGRSEAFLRFGSSLSIITTHANLAALRELIDAYLLKFGAQAAEQEPPCTCNRTDVDQLDATECEIHNPESAWNRAHPASVAPTPIEESEDVQF